MRRDSQGFTLIELLVVIAIIGILSSVVLASLGTARARSRDTRRVEDLQQIGRQVHIASSMAPTNFTGCTTAGARVTNCTLPALAAYTDPSGATTACTAGSTSSCDYAMFVQTGSTYPANTENWKVCAWMEIGTPPRTDPGLINVNVSGSVRPGC